MVTYLIAPSPHLSGTILISLYDWRRGEMKMILQIIKSAAMMLGTQNWRKNGRISGSNYSRMNQVKSVEDNL